MAWKKKKAKIHFRQDLSIHFFPTSLKGLFMLHIYSTDNVTQNQESYDAFVQSLIPFLSTIPCPKCQMVGFLILYGLHPRKFINEDMVRIEILIQRVQCTSCGSTHVVLPTTVLPYFLHIILNIKNAVHSNSEMNITYMDYLKRKFSIYLIDFINVFHRFFQIVYSILRNRNIFYGFVIRPTQLR